MAVGHCHLIMATFQAFAVPRPHQLIHQSKRAIVLKVTDLPHDSEGSVSDRLLRLDRGYRLRIRVRRLYGRHEGSSLSEGAGCSRGEGGRGSERRMAVPVYGHHGRRGGRRCASARGVEGREEVVVWRALPVSRDPRGVLHGHHHLGGAATIPGLSNGSLAGVSSAGEVRVGGRAPLRRSYLAATRHLLL